MYRQAMILSALVCLTDVSLYAPANAVTMAECGVKYEAARKAGTLNGLSWNDYRKAQCGEEAKVEAAPTASASGALFPPAIAPKYASEPSYKARRLTCLDQYRANKGGGGNGDLKWIQKGGGYYSECNKRLKGG
jgi:hypothetical protein